MEEKTLHIVIVGHIDHGKSTLVGRLFYDTGCLPPDKVEELKRISAEMGKELEFAYMMDHLEEERQKGITIDIAHTFFATPKRRYVIIDAPGHKEFLKNMITGSSQAQAALLLVDISQGIKEQTRRHCYILGLLGIKQVAVLVNKMDMVDYSEASYKAIRAEIGSVLGKLNIKPAYIIPIAARLGDNIAGKSDKLPWFKGPTVLEALDSFSTNEAQTTRLRFPVQDVYDVDGEKTAVGRVESGVVRKAQDVYILPDGTKGRITAIKQFMRDDIGSATVGECIGVTSGSALKRGQIVVDEVSSTITDTIRANIFWLIDKDYKIGIPLTWKCATQEAKGKIEKIHKRFDPASIEVVEEGAKEIRPAEIAEVEIKLDRKVVIDRFSDIPEMGRFVLEHMGHPVAGGIII